MSFYTTGRVWQRHPLDVARDRPDFHFASLLRQAQDKLKLRTGPLYFLPFAINELFLFDARPFVELHLSVPRLSKIIVLLSID